MEYLDDAQSRNFQKWNILGSYVWPNYYVGNTYQDEIIFLKNWIGDRLLWIDSNLVGNCYEILGCTDSLSCNFDPIANTNDWSCLYNSASYDTLISPVSINWNGLLLSNSGDYSFTLINSVGCDSIANIYFILNTVGVYDVNNIPDKNFFDITTILGQKTTNSRKNNMLLYIYDTGILEKKIIIE